MASGKRTFPASLGSLVANIDGQIRRAGIKAHAAALVEAAKTGPLTVGGVEIDGSALVPRDLLEARRLSLDLNIVVSDDRVSLRKPGICGGNVGTLKIEWEAVAAPEATALVRTKAELTLDGKLDTVPMRDIEPATPVEDTNG